MEADNGGDEISDYLHVRPMGTSYVKIKASDECPFKSEFNKLVPLRQKMENEPSWQNAKEYYSLLKTLYVRYGTCLEDKQSLYASVSNGHAFIWTFPDDRDIEFPDLGFEYMCCLLAMTIHIIQHISFEINLTDMNKLSIYGVSIVKELLSVAKLTCPKRNFYLPIELKSTTLYSVAPVFIIFFQMCSFFTTLQGFSLSGDIDDPKMKESCEEMLPMMVGLYQGIFATKAMIFEGWKYIERAKLGIGRETIDAIEERMKEMKVILGVMSFFTDKIIKFGRVNELTVLTDDIVKTMDGGEYVYSKLSEMHELLLQLKSRFETATRFQKKLESESEKMAIAKSLADYIDKYNVGPLIFI